MEREYPDYVISLFVSSGPKSYAIKLKHRESGETVWVQKMKGLTLSCTAIEQGLGPELLLKAVTEEQTLRKTFVYKNSIGRDKRNMQITAYDRIKTFSVVNNKVITLPNYDCVPFGIW